MPESIEQFRKRLEWSQARLAKELGVAQPTVFRMENGQEPSGPVKKLLQQLMAAHPVVSREKARAA